MPNLAINTDMTCYLLLFFFFQSSIPLSLFGENSLDSWRWTMRANGELGFRKRGQTCKVQKTGANLQLVSGMRAFVQFALFISPCTFFFVQTQTWVKSAYKGKISKVVTRTRVGCEDWKGYNTGFVLKMYILRWGEGAQQVKIQIQRFATKFIN